MTTTNTEQLIARIRSGDHRAFELLVNEYKGVVYSLTLQMLKSREEAEEVAQDVFVKVYKSIGSFKGDSKFSTWLYRVTRNRCLDYLKKKRITYNELVISDSLITQLDETTNALEMMMENERNKKLRKCLEHLSAEDSAILTLFYFQEKKLNELADVLDISVNLAKVRLHRARKRLATVLIKNMEPELLKNYG